MRHGFCLKSTRPRPEESPVSLLKDGSEPEWGAIVSSFLIKEKKNRQSGGFSDVENSID